MRLAELLKANRKLAAVYLLKDMATHLGNPNIERLLREVAPAKDGLPDFMGWSGLKTLPWFWEPFKSSWFAIPAGPMVAIAVDGPVYPTAHQLDCPHRCR